MKKTSKIFLLIKCIYNRILSSGKLGKKEILDLKYAKNNFPVVTSTEATLDHIINYNASLCRFGDAEFDICNFENLKDPYQIPSPELSTRLKHILTVNDGNKLVIAIPPFCSKYNNIPNYYRGLTFWEWYWMKRCYKIYPLFKRKIYGNSFVSRDAVFYENSLKKITKIWSGRSVVFVVSKNGRFIYDDRLFGVIKRIDYVYVPATNAFNNYQSIFNECKRYPKDRLFLIAAGPTATVLAYDLYCLGYQAIDMGHITNCYLQYLGESNSPESMPMIRSENKNG